MDLNTQIVDVTKAGSGQAL